MCVYIYIYIYIEFLFFLVILMHVLSLVYPSCHSSKPRRTDEGGSRLLHKAILGLNKMEKTSPAFSRGRVSSREEDILLPHSMQTEHTHKNMAVMRNLTHHPGSPKTPLVL